jgi:hypothetical protein
LPIPRKKTINEFLELWRSNSSSKHDQNNNLKVIIIFINFIRSSFDGFNKNKKILEFLNQKVKR